MVCPKTEFAMEIAIWLLQISVKIDKVTALQKFYETQILIYEVPATAI